MKLDQYATVEKGKNLLIYGPPKSGKTALAADLANQGYKVHALDLEQGAATFLLVVEEENYDNVEIYSIMDTPSMPNAVKVVTRVLDAKGIVTFCEAHGTIACMECKKAGAPEASIDSREFGPKDVLLVDSVTQLSNSAMVHSLGPASALSTKKPEWDNYSAQGQLLDFIFAKAQAAPFHTIFISHEADIEQEDGSSKITPIGGTRNYSKNLARFFDHVIYCQVKNKKHSQISLSTENAKIIAGNRFNIDIQAVDGGLATLLNPPKELRDAARQQFRDSKLASVKRVGASLPGKKP